MDLFTAMVLAFDGRGGVYIIAIAGLLCIIFMLLHFPDRKKV